MTALDICSARGRHAVWCGGVRPRFLLFEVAAQNGSVQVCDAPHPETCSLDVISQVSPRVHIRREDLVPK